MAGTIQTEYGFIDQRLEGQLADLYEGIEIDDFVVEETNGILPGKAVVRGTDPGKQVSLGNANVLGISVRERTRENSAAGITGVLRFNNNALVPVLRRGKIYVQLVVASSAVAAGNQVACLANGDIVRAGTANSTVISGATFESAGSQGDIVTIRLD